MQADIAKEARAIRQKKATILGLVFLDMVEEGTWPEEQLLKILDERVLNQRQRALFDLGQKQPQKEVTVPPKSVPIPLNGHRAASKTQATQEIYAAAGIQQSMAHERSSPTKALRERVGAAITAP